ncbi:hypothetical protein [Polaromonas sp.]|uniref:hypothetical protein n=1 Tax=Polaromonas sp. TaxID=1869339 RepID=UPI00326594AC
MVDVAVVQQFLLDVIPAVATVGVACLGIKWAIETLRFIREQIGIDGVEGAVNKYVSEDGRTVYLDRDGENIYETDAVAPDWEGYTAADDARDRAAAGLQPNPNWTQSAEIQNAMISQDTAPVYRPATSEEAAVWADINARFDAQEAADAAFFGAMTPYEKYLAKASPEDLARDAELEAESAAEDARIAAKYGVPVLSEADNNRLMALKEISKSQDFDQ